MIVKASLLPFQHDGVAASSLSEWSPVPPALSSKDLSGGRIQLLNIPPIWKISWNTVTLDEDSASESISDTEDWLNWNGDLDNATNSYDDCSADFESDMKHGNVIEDPECPEQWDVSDVPNDPEMIRPMQVSSRQAENVSVMVNIFKTRRYKDVKKM